MENLYIFVILLFGSFLIYAWWKLFTKAGYEGWQCVLIIIPIVNIITFLYYTFAEWPITKRLKKFEKVVELNKEFKKIVDLEIEDEIANKLAKHGKLLNDAKA